MIKHFDQWRTRNLPLTLAGDANIATYVANWLLGNAIPDTIPQQYFSAKHNTVIDVRECGAFIIELENRDNHTGKNFFIQNQAQIASIANGTFTLWENENDEMEIFRTYIRKKWLIVPSNSQLAERWVKDSNECTYTNKNESLANMYALVRSTTVMVHKDDAQVSYGSRVRKATRNLSAGRIGERMDRRTGAIEDNNVRLRDGVRGNLLIETIIKETNDIDEKVIKLHLNSSVKKRIKEKLTSDADQFETLRKDEVINSLATVMNQENHKPFNVIQSQIGYELTTYQRREIRYSKVITKHIALVREELQHREIPFSAIMKITVLKNLLKVHDKTKQQREFLAKNNLPPRDEDLKLLVFKPEKRSAAEWGDAYKD